MRPETLQPASFATMGGLKPRTRRILSTRVTNGAGDSVTGSSPTRGREEKTGM